MSITRRLRLKIARIRTQPSGARIKAQLRRDAKQGLMSNWFFQGEGL